MNAQVIVTCLLIILARIGDVSLGTIRTLCVVNGRRGLAWGLGFFEVLIWVLAVSQVIRNLTHPAYALSYAFGFATGNYVGMMLESWLAFGIQVVRVFTRRGAELAGVLRDDGFQVTEFIGQGRDGPVSVLFIQTDRKHVRRVADGARAYDPACYYVVEDIRHASTPFTPPTESGGWRGILKRK
jgi:uncharacterized protein YebE (UPF0316 family)